VRVQGSVEGEHEFRGLALNGPEDKQKAAVKAAMQWRFKKHRGGFNNDVNGGTHISVLNV
jgi:hypothetical protein